MNIVMLSKDDFAGSGWRICEAIRTYTKHKVFHVVTKKHRYGYPTDLLYPVKIDPRKNIRLYQDVWPILNEKVNEANIVHFKGDEPPTRDWNNVKIPQRVKIVITVGGSNFRRHGGEGISLAKWSMKEYLLSDLRTALSPDLNYPEYKGYYTPYPIHSEKEKYCWSGIEPFRIGYYVSQNNRKGVKSHTLPALQLLKKEFKFEVIPLENVSYEQSLEMKKNMTIFIDQIAETGCYGNSAVEAMQYGVPVIAYISERSLQQCQRNMFANSPVLNPGPKPEGLVILLRNILSGKLNLSKISEKSKEYCDNFHGYIPTAKLWDRLYRRLF